MSRFTISLESRGEQTLARVLEWLLRRHRSQKRLLVLVVDAACAIAAIWLAFSLRLGYWQLFTPPVLKVAAAILLPFPVIFLLFGVYRNIFRFSGSGTIYQLGQAIVILAVPLLAIFTFSTADGVPRTIAFLVPMIFFLLATMSRIAARYLLGDVLGLNRGGTQRKRTLIYGAGSSGQQLANSLKLDAHFSLIGFLDDDARLHRQRLNGLVVHHAETLSELVTNLRIDAIFLAIPGAESRRRKEIIEALSGLGVHVQTLPSMIDFINGSVSLNDVRELRVEDLLGRDPVKPNEVLLGRTIVGKTIIVTGAGGSIGSELCRQIADIRPKKLVLAEVSEPSLYLIERELRHSMARSEVDFPLIPELVNMVDAAAVERMFRRHSPDTVFHSAAYKHVPMVEANVLSGLKNNVIGTRNAARAARNNGSTNFILISTDKAVRPTNVMGASKRICELLLQALASEGGKTRFSMVRFGNVLGSSGSVVPQFEKQIRNGGPVTLTHRDITRFFMTIPEAAQLVIQSGAMAEGGEVFLLDMGAPLRIYDLARTMVELSGKTVRDQKNPAGDIEIIEIGLRPGEKLYEELLINADSMPTRHVRIMQARETGLDPVDLMPRLADLEEAIERGDTEDAKRLVRLLVPEYAPNALMEPETAKRIGA